MGVGYSPPPNSGHFPGNIFFGGAGWIRRRRFQTLNHVEHVCVMVGSCTRPARPVERGANPPPPYITAAKPCVGPWTSQPTALETASWGTSYSDYFG